MGLPIFLGYLPEMLKNKTLIRSNKENVLVEIDLKFPQIKLNGLHISTGCFFTNVSMNGLNISLLNRFNTFNGVSVVPIGTQANLMNGVSIGLYNGSNNCNGVAIGFMNESIQFKGIQLGIYNNAQTVKGIQIGIMNVSKNRGLQIGIWNTNAKRTMPFINW